MNTKPVTVIPLLIFLIVIFLFGYFTVVGGNRDEKIANQSLPPSPRGEEILVPETSTVVAVVEPSATATRDATETAVAAAETASAVAGATALAIEAATAEANAGATQVAQTATAAANSTATAATVATATGQAKATAQAIKTATFEAGQRATAAAKATATRTALILTATAESQQAAAARAAEASAAAATATAEAFKPVPPPSDAVVSAPTGVVILHLGPGDQYEGLASLPNGTALEVMRRVVGKDDWLKVAANPGSVGQIEGYVNLASGLIEVSVDLNDIPPIYEFGPALVEPDRYESRAVEAFINFRWQDYGTLEAEQYYSTILVRDDLSDADACYHWQTKVPQVDFKPGDYGCTPGDYSWGVSIATKIGEAEGKSIWRDDSHFDERNPIGIGVPHSGKPKNGNGGGGSGTGKLPSTP